VIANLQGSLVDRRYYTPREVSDLMRISPTTVMKMIHERRLFAVRVSERIYRIPVGAVARLQAGEERSYSAAEAVVDVLPPLGEQVTDREPQAMGA
jgi:excisionase family DNA binding protein